MDRTEYAGRVISIRNLFAFLFSKVVYILVTVIVFSVIFAGIKTIKTTNTPNTDVIIPSGTEDLRERLSNEELNEADGIISRYIFCLEYVSGVIDNMRLMRNTYLLHVGNYPVDVLSNAIVMNDDEYQNVMEIMKINEDGYHKLSDRVMIKTYLNEESGEKKLFLVVSVYGTNDEQCARAMAAIELFVDRVQNDFKPEHGITEWKLVSSVSSSSDSQDIAGSREERMERLSKVGSSISSLSSAFGFLTEEQKQYVNSVIKPINNSTAELSDETASSTASVVGYAILGGLLGCVLSIGALVLFYLVNGTIKTTDDLKSSWGDIIFDTMFLPGEMNSIGNKVLRVIRGVDAEAIDADMAVAVSRLTGIIDEIKPIRIVFIQDSESELCKKLEDQLIKDKDIVENREVLKYSMNDFAKQCLNLSEKDAVVILAELEKTKQKDVERWLRFCAKNRKTVAAVMTVD